MGNFFWILICIIVSISIFAFYRTNWVYRVKLGCIEHEDYPESYDKLPSYNYMFWKFWCFDVNKFMKDPKPLR